MPGAFDFVMTEHAAWLPASRGVRRVFAAPGGGRWLASVDGGTLTLGPLSTTAAEPARDVFTLPEGLSIVPELVAALHGLGRVVRFRNSDLWDAIGTAVIRQVIRAGQSKKLYRACCEAYGERARLPDGGTYALSRNLRLCSG